MGLFRRLKPELALRLGLGAMYLYSGFSLVRKPDDLGSALGSLPKALLVIIDQIGPERYLSIQGAGEIAIGLIFLLWFAPRWLVLLASFLSALEMALILWLVGVDPATFRDIGLLGGSSALWLLYLRQ